MMVRCSIRHNENIDKSRHERHRAVSRTILDEIAGGLNAVLGRSSRELLVFVEMQQILRLLRNHLDDILRCFAAIWMTHIWALSPHPVLLSILN